MKFLMVMMAMYLGASDPIVVVNPKIETEQSCKADGEKLKATLLRPEAGKKVVTDAAYQCQPITPEQIDRLIDETHGPTGWMLVSLYKLDNPAGLQPIVFPKIMSSEDCQSLGETQKKLATNTYFGNNKQIVREVQFNCQALDADDVKRLLFSTVDIP